MGDSFDPSMIRDDQWVFTGMSTDGLRRYYTYTDTALDITIQKTENVMDAEIIEQNQQLFNESESKRWGDGQVAARIPLNILYKDFAGRWGDTDFSDWWMNHDDNRKYRTFKGKI